MIHSIDEIHQTPKRFIQRKKDIDILSEFASKELKNELESLLDEQRLQLTEISQLKAERDMLFGLLRTKKSKVFDNAEENEEKRIIDYQQKTLKNTRRKIVSNQINFSKSPVQLNDASVLCSMIPKHKKSNLGFQTFDPISIVPIEDIPTRDEGNKKEKKFSIQNQSFTIASSHSRDSSHEFVSSSVQTLEDSNDNITRPVRRHVKVQANMRPKDSCEFSKKLFLDQLADFNLPVFDKAADVVSSAKSGDAILTYFTKLCGSKIAHSDEEISFLQDTLVKMDNRNRSTIRNSIHSLKLAHRRECDLRKALSDVLQVSN